MSSHSTDAPCPNCKGVMDVNYETRPFESISGECINCGFFFYTVADQCALEGLNERRKEAGLRKKKTLPRIKKFLKSYIKGEQP